MSKNSWDVGTGWISFHVVFMLGNLSIVDVDVGNIGSRRRRQEIRDQEVQIVENSNF